MAPAERKIPAPKINPETAGFWSAASEGRLVIGRCRACNEAHFYPRSICPFCFSDNTILETAVGKGTIYSFSIMRRVPVPYVMAYVTLEEGPTMMSNIVDCDPEAVRIGQAVQLIFKPSDGGPPVPMFRCG